MNQDKHICLFMAFSLVKCQTCLHKEGEEKTLGEPSQVAWTSHTNRGERALHL